MWSSILKEFNTDKAKLELLVLGLLGKLLSGPWMTMFYVAPEEQMTHIDGIAVVKDVIVQALTNGLSPSSPMTLTS